MRDKWIEFHSAVIDSRQVFLADCTVIIKRANINKLKDVLIFTLDSNGEVFIQDKTAEKSESFSTDYNGGGKW